MDIKELLKFYLVYHSTIILTVLSQDLVCPNNGLKHPSRYICNDLTDPCPEPWACWQGEACCISSNFLQTVSPPANNFPPVNIEINNRVPFNQQDFHPPGARPLEQVTSTTSAIKIITDPFDPTKLSNGAERFPFEQFTETTTEPAKTRSFYLLRSSDITDKDVRDFLHLNPMAVTTVQETITTLKSRDQTNFKDIFQDKDPFSDTTLTNDVTDKQTSQIQTEEIRNPATTTANPAATTTSPATTSTSPATTTTSPATTSTSPATTTTSPTTIATSPGTTTTSATTTTISAVTTTIRSAKTTTSSTFRTTSDNLQTTSRPKSNPTWVTQRGTNIPNLSINHWPASNIDQTVSVLKTNQTFSTASPAKSVNNRTEFFTSSIQQTTTAKPKLTSMKPKQTQDTTKATQTITKFATLATKTDFFQKLFASKKPHLSTKSKPDLSLSKDETNQTFTVNNTVADANQLMWQHWKKNAHFSLGSMSGSIQKISAKFPSQAEDKDFLARLAGYNGKPGLCPKKKYPDGRWSINVDNSNGTMVRVLQCQHDMQCPHQQKCCPVWGVWGIMDGLVCMEP